MDSSDIDAALVTKLQSDATLTGLMPGGVFIDEAPHGLVQFVIVNLVDAKDAPIFEGRGSEDLLYLVKAVELSSVSVKNIKAAAARIDVLLDPQPPAARATLTVAGFSLLVMRRESRIRMTEVDLDDPALRWSHRGGRYQVMVAPLGT